MKQVLILERCTSGLNRVNESASTRNLQDYVMNGTFTEFDKLNRNNRIYTAEKFIPHLNELANRVKEFGVVYGEYDHPEGFDIQLKNASHIITDVKYIAEEKRVHGQINLLTTKFGKEARALVNDGCPVFVSSRAAGVTESNGHVQVRRLFTYDIVADPGFGAAKMNMKNMNESFGLAEEGETMRIYDMTNESTTNELFNMNGNDNVTRTMMREYGDHLMAHVAKLEEQLVKYISEGRDASEITQTAELLDNTHTNLSKVQEYLDYLSTELVVQVTKNDELNKVVETLTTQNNETIAKLDKAVAYMELMSEKVDGTISFVEHIAENVKSNIEFSEYIAEHVKTDKGITASLTEKVAETENYAKMIFEGLNTSVDTLSETVRGNIAFTEYVAEHVKSSVEYVEYVVEAVEENAEYAQYLATNLDGLIVHNESTINTLNAAFAQNGVNEAVISIESPVTSLGLDNNEEETAEDGENTEDGEAGAGDVTSADIDAAPAAPEVTGIAGDEGASSDTVNSVEDAQPTDGEAAAQPAQDGEVVAPAQDGEVVAQPAQDGEVVAQPAEGEVATEVPAADDAAVAQPTEDVPVNAVETEEVPASPASTDATRIELDGDEIHITKNGQETVIKLGGGAAVAESLTDKLSTLIAEAKKRKAAETNEPHFFKFLTESQVVDFKALAEDQQEQVKVAMNESEYFSGHDVLKVIHKTLAANEPTLNEKLVANIPADVQENWTGLNESQQSAVLATARFYAGDLNNPRQVENFWRTRSLAASLNENKLVVNENSKDDNSFSEDEINRFINRFKSI